MAREDNKAANNTISVDMEALLHLAGEKQSLVFDWPM